MVGDRVRSAPRIEQQHAKLADMGHKFKLYGAEFAIHDGNQGGVFGCFKKIINRNRGDSAVVTAADVE